MSVRTKASRGIGGVALLVIPLLLGACGGSKATATTNAPAPAAIASVPATVAATAVATAPLPTATVVPATPTPLAGTATAIVATGTALSATSSAFVGTATAGTTTSGTAQTTVAVSDPQAQATVDKARTRFDQVNTLHFALNVEGDVYIDTLRTQKLKSADGDLIRPDKVSLTAKASIGPINAQLKFIQIGDQAYLTNILSGKWEKAPAGFAYDPRVVFDTDKGVSAILGKVRGWAPVDTVKINGVDTQHVHGPVPVASVNDLVSSSLRGDNVDVDIYVEPKNGDVVRFILSEQPAAVAQGTAAARWTLDLSKQNENLKIDAPTIGG